MSDLKIFGETEFISSKRARVLSVKILSNGLRITLPSGKIKQDAIKWILDNKELIIRKQEKLRARKSRTLIRENEIIKTYTFSIIPCKAARSDVFFNLNNGTLKIEYPDYADLESDHLQQICWRGIKYFLKKEAGRVLPEKLAKLANEHRFNYCDLKLQSGKTRWGSCSSKKNINLSIFLMLLPEHLIDYVILHELCHTVEMNHSDKFWKLMDDVTEGKSKRLRAAIKNYEIPG